ncbi:hypothetical protein [endosymbiont GvMRE of Glomus versiforme]|uniref:hypothetical protein n=1 Tax=endosymbiont GvMRE of Glomus versiforme TaxID=2039283 RepID=UPI000EE20DE3|nr:hypothetical protein [endosymbiont GvMRE of Glomus versiforme]RHZ36177.1 hypothetical protein GvMRE_Ic2g75 [endosymbiont GvMRE of Glomus versiforme]
MDKSSQIKQILTKIEMPKIIACLETNPQSKTLKQIIRCSQRAWESKDPEEVFRLAVRVAYALDTIVNKADYVKNDKNKKYCLEISQELFKETVGQKK